MEHSGNTALFGIFLISIFSLFLFPYTLYFLFSSGEAEQTAQPWQQVSVPCPRFVSHMPSSLFSTGSLTWITPACASFSQGKTKKKSWLAKKLERMLSKGADALWGAAP